jgi:hypothetical protein
MKKQIVILSFFVSLFFTSSSIRASMMYFNSISSSNNTSTMADWYAAIEIMQPQYLADFENITAGTNINSNKTLFTEMYITADVAGISSSVYIRDKSSDFGNSAPGPSPSTKALAVSSLQEINIYFADNASDTTTPVDYVSFYDIDARDLIITVNYIDGTKEQIHVGAGSGGLGDSSTTAEFFGIYCNDKPRIYSINLSSYLDDLDMKWGIDEIRYGEAPEPATLVLLGLGAMIFRKSK